MKCEDVEGIACDGKLGWTVIVITVMDITCMNHG